MIKNIFRNKSGNPESLKKIQISAEYINSCYELLVPILNEKYYPSCYKVNDAKGYPKFYHTFNIILRLEVQIMYIGSLN